MKPRIIKILYWFVTVLFALFMLYSGISEIMQIPQGVEIMKHLGYPMYVNTIIGVAKILGAIAIIQWKFKIIKEWAYAGFTIDIIGASASFYFVGDGMFATLMPLIFLAVMFASYFLWKKVEQTKVTT
ncbi:MAG: DoxX family protein [Nanoarchaeota archaeon]